MDTRFRTSKGFETFPCGEFFLQESFKSVQRAVSERGGDNSTLGSPIHRFVKDVFFHIPGFQPLLENKRMRGHDLNALLRVICAWGDISRPYALLKRGPG